MEDEGVYSLVRSTPSYLGAVPEVSRLYSALGHPAFQLPEQPATELARALRDIELSRISNAAAIRSEELWTERWKLSEQLDYEQRLVLAQAKASYKRTVAECTAAVALTGLQHGIMIRGIRMKYREGGWFSTFEETTLHIDYA